MDVLHLIAANNFIPVNKTLIRYFGTDCAILIGHFAGLQLYHQKPFYNTAEQIEEETGIKIHSIRKAVQILQENKILIVEKRGTPCRLYYYLDNEILANILLSQKTSFENSKNKSLENKTTSFENSKDYLYKINNKNKLKNKNITVLGDSQNNDITESISFNLEKTKLKRTNSPKQFKDRVKERQLQQYLPFALALAKTIESNKNIRILQTPSKINAWAKEFKTLIEKQNITQERVETALDWYDKNIGGDYVPVIESGKSFREKFVKLEDAVKRASYKPKKAWGSTGTMKLNNGKTTLQFDKGIKVKIV